MTAPQDGDRQVSPRRIRGLTLASQVTIARVVLIPVFLVALLGRFPNAGPWLSAALFGLLAATDAVDGYLARSRNEVTTFGKFIDPLADKLLVTAALVALVELGSLPAWVAVVIISREFIVSGLRLVAVAEGHIIAASIWGKVKTVFQIMAIIGFIMIDEPLLTTILGTAGATAFVWLAWVVMGIALVLTIVSMAEYFYHARQILTGPWNPEDRQ